MVVVIQIYIRIFNTKEDILNGISFTLDILKIKIEHKFMLNGLNQKIHQIIQIQDITLHQNSLSSLHEINTSLDLMVWLVKQDLIQVKVLLFLKRISIYQKIHSHSILELIHIIKMLLNLNLKSNQIQQFQIMLKAVQIQLLIRKLNQIKIQKVMVMDSG